MPITSKMLVVVCPKCQTENKLEDANDVTQIKCTLCQSVIDLPQTVGSIDANHVTVVGDLDIFDF